MFCPQIDALMKREENAVDYGLTNYSLLITHQFLLDKTLLKHSHTHSWYVVPEADFPAPRAEISSCSMII